MPDAICNENELTEHACPQCGENHIDHLVWIDDETVKCETCGHVYKP